MTKRQAWDEHLRLHPYNHDGQQDADELHSEFRHFCYGWGACSADWETKALSLAKKLHKIAVHQDANGDFHLLLQSLSARDALLTLVGKKVEDLK